LFTGRTLDILDNGSLKLQYNRNRYYDQYTGRWLTNDPLGIMPNPQRPNRFDPLDQYRDGLNIYEYVGSEPVRGLDKYGLFHGNKESWGAGSPPVSPPPCGVCGPDVTEPLRRFRGRLISDFYSWPKSKRLWKCMGMWSSAGWDIDELVHGSGFYPGCSTCGCRTTVEVNGRCYSQYAVNYYMWGVVNALCSLTPSWSTEVGLEWTFISGDYWCKREWALAGLRGDLRVDNGLCGKYRGCKPKCPEKRTKDFTYNWEGGLPIFSPWI